MAKLTEEVKKFIQDRFDKQYNGCVGVLSSLRADGTPNASPKHFRIRDEEHLEFTDVFSKTLSDVLGRTPQVTVVFFDAQTVMGYRMKGRAMIETFGPLFMQAVNRLESLGFKPKAVISIQLEEVQALSFGPNTGKRVG